MEEPGTRDAFTVFWHLGQNINIVVISLDSITPSPLGLAARANIVSFAKRTNPMTNSVSSFESR